jgi:hypothetical protein
MLSMRAIFHWMLAGWFAAAGLLAMFLGENMENRRAGELVARLFSEPSVPPATPVLSAEAPRKPEKPRPAKAAPPAAKAETGWIPMPHGLAQGKGWIGAPRFAALPDGSLEVRLAYRGRLGGETHFTPRDVKIDTRLDALSVDLHGEWEFSRQADTHIEKSTVCRVQIYRHPKYVRVSAISCAQESDRPTLAVRAFFSPGEIRLLFSSAKG